MKLLINPDEMYRIIRKQTKLWPFEIRTILLIYYSPKLMTIPQMWTTMRIYKQALNDQRDVEAAVAALVSRDLIRLGEGSDKAYQITKAGIQMIAKMKAAIISASKDTILA